MSDVNRHNYDSEVYGPPMQTMGDRVREARLGKGVRPEEMSQEELAKKVGCKQATIAQLESGRIKKTSLLGKIAHHTGYSAAWLETGKPPKEIDPLQELHLSVEERRAAAAFIRTLRGTKPP